MTTQQQLDSLTAAVGRIEELADKIKQSLANDDPAEAELVLAELGEAVAGIGEAIGAITPEAAPPAPAYPETPEPPAQPGD